MNPIRTKSELREIASKYVGPTKRDCTQKQWVDREWEKHQSRTNPPRHFAGCGLPRKRIVSLDQAQTRDTVSDLLGRKKNHRDTKPDTGCTRLRDISLGNYSSRCTWTHWVYDVHIESWCYISSCGRLVVYRFDDDRGKHKGSLRAPRGYRWQHDEDNVLILRKISTGTEYHPTNTDLLLGVAHCRTELLKNEKARKLMKRAEREAEREAKRIAKQLEHVTITYTDARRAGNCEAGIIGYCRQQGIPFRKANVAIPYRGETRPEIRRAALAALQRLEEVQI